MIYMNQFFFGIFNQIRNIYLNSDYYNSKISQTYNENLIYKPSPHILSSLIKYKKKNRIEDFSLDNIWNNNNLNDREYKNLNNFYWFFNLDLKSSKKNTHSVITNWINNNHKYKKKVGILI